MKKINFFWVSYADLMTSLFFIVLLLFGLSWALYKENDPTDLKEEIANLKFMNQNLSDSLGIVAVQAGEAKKIAEIKTAINSLPSAYFKFDEEYQRHQLNKKISFETGSSVIDTTEYDYLKSVGNELVSLIDKLKKDQDKNIRYLVIIEGMASKDSYSRNYELSYERALSLYRLWENEGIEFDKKRCEVQIAGSGIGGIGRSVINAENQRFLIQIIPKVGQILEKLE